MERVLQSRRVKTRTEQGDTIRIEQSRVDLSRVKESNRKCRRQGQERPLKGVKEKEK